MEDNLQIAVELGKQLLEKNTELELEYNRLRDENDKLHRKVEEYKQVWINSCGTCTSEV